MKMSESVAALAKAMVAAHGDMENASKNAKNPHFKSAYADLAEIINASREVLHRHGLTIIQSPGYSEGAVTITALVMHTSGEWLQDVLTVPVGKLDAQGVGSAITYGRRYQRAALCGLAQEDDDGNAASQQPARQQRQAPPDPRAEECKRAVAEAENKEQLRVLWNDAHAGGYLDQVADHIKARKAAMEAPA